jgi:hypothetical protein
VRPDSSAILNALVAKLGSDPELLTLLPNGIYEDLAPPASTRFAIVSHVITTDQAVLHQGRVIEDGLYLVEARVLRSSGGDVAAAAARIDTLLDDGALDVPGYRITALHREELIRGTEVDDVDRAILWKRRGGRYRVTAYREILAEVVAAEEVYDTRADVFGLFDYAVWFDGPLKIPDPAGIEIQLLSSNLAVAPHCATSYSPGLSVLDVQDPSAPGRAMLRFRRALNMATWAGLTFTLSDASPRTNWSQILNRESGEPVADALGDVVLTIPILP